ncbi:hypothetical protein IBTHAUMO2_440012 [Nitrosopumilaceae archaeon]|nr:hypothetical protein IBTHAUMO2_440012 [Nitrosopumilaceae archaeon]
MTGICDAGIPACRTGRGLRGWEVVEYGPADKIRKMTMRFGYWARLRGSPGGPESAPAEDPAAVLRLV